MAQSDAPFEAQLYIRQIPHHRKSATCPGFRLADPIHMLAWRAFAFLFAIRALSGVTFDIGELGFRKNIGQHPSDVRFQFRDCTFRKYSVEVLSGLTLRFDDSAADKLVPLEPSPVILHAYLGTEQTTWWENIPHFKTIRQEGIYPGIDADWSVGATRPMLRFLVSAGADPSKIRMAFSGDSLSVIVSADGGANISWRNDRISFAVPHAYQLLGSEKTLASARLISGGNHVVELNVSGFDRTRPLFIEMGQALDLGRATIGQATPTPDGGFLVTGSVSYLEIGRQFLAKVSATSSIEYFTWFNGAIPSWLAVGTDGSTIIAGNSDPRWGDPPVPSTAPQPARVDGGPQSWIGQFNGTGKLLASTFVDGAVQALTVDRSGAAHLATPYQIRTWIPGLSHFRSAMVAPGVIALKASTTSEEVAFAAIARPNLITTPGVTRATYQGPHDLLAGAFDGRTGGLLWATYVAVNGAGFNGSVYSARLAFPTNGSLWIASEFQEGPYGNIDSRTLVALAPRGTSVIRSQSLPAPAGLALDATGNVRVILYTENPSLETLPDAPRRAGCSGSKYLHLTTFKPQGQIIAQTYLPNAPTTYHVNADELVTITYPELGGGPPLLQRISMSLPSEPGIGCIVHAASRRPVSDLTRGGLFTIVGTALGPPEAFAAPLDALRNTPTKLAGVEVSFSGNPLPLVAVQQGLITFYAPETTPPAPLFYALEVKRNGAVVASTNASLGFGTDFALAAADGSGAGAAAALNENGTVNSRTNPARWGTAVTLFGTGPLPNSFQISVGGYRASVEYAGPAPGSYPGVKQLNLRLPTIQFPSAGWRTVFVSNTGVQNPRILIFVAP